MSWVHITDAASATIAAIERGEAGIYHVAARIDVPGSTPSVIGGQTDAGCVTSSRLLLSLN
jgi:hypothetical protein